MICRMGRGMVFVNVSGRMKLCCGCIRPLTRSIHHIHCCGRLVVALERGVGPDFVRFGCVRGCTRIWSPYLVRSCLVLCCCSLSQSIVAGDVGSSASSGVCILPWDVRTRKSQRRWVRLSTRCRLSTYRRGIRIETCVFLGCCCNASDGRDVASCCLNS